MAVAVVWLGRFQKGRSSCVLKMIVIGAAFKLMVGAGAFSQLGVLTPN